MLLLKRSRKPNKTLVSEASNPDGSTVHALEFRFDWLRPGRCLNSSGSRQRCQSRFEITAALVAGHAVMSSARLQAVQSADLC